MVTGANKGIGLAIIRRLCKEFNGDVYLTARSEENGATAIATLSVEGLKPLFHQLDIASAESIETLKKHILEKYGGIDVLVNNAGMLYKSSSTAPFLEQATVTLRTNFTGTLDMSDRATSRANRKRDLNGRTSEPTCKTPPGKVCERAPL